MKDNHTPGERKKSIQEILSEADFFADTIHPPVSLDYVSELIKTLIHHVENQSDLLGECLEAIEGAMRIKDLWTFPPGIPLVGNAEQEAIATSIMEEQFKAILAKAKGE